MATPPERLTRIAVVNDDKCKPKQCNLECKRWCPVVQMGTPTLPLLFPVIYIYLSILHFVVT